MFETTRRACELLGREYRLVGAADAILVHSIEERMTSRPGARRSRASSSASAVSSAAGGPSTATRSGCAVVTDSIASPSR